MWQAAHHACISSLGADVLAEVQEAVQPIQQLALAWWHAGGHSTPAPHFLHKHAVDKNMHVAECWQLRLISNVILSGMEH